MQNDELRRYLEFYQDLGVKTLYKRAAIAPALATAPVAQTAAPVAQTAAPVAQTTAPAAQTVAPVAQTAAPVAQTVAPVAQTAAPAAPALKPVTIVSPEPPKMIELPPLAPVGDSMDAIRADIGDCKRCRLCEQRNKIVFGAGNEAARLVFVGEGPGADEDASGLPFVGRAGQLLTQMIEGTAAKEGIPIKRSDVYICNVVKCRPPENRTPEADEMEICGQFLSRQLLTINPKAICVLGATAAKAVLGMKIGVTKMRGEWQKWRDIPVMVTYHPSYLLRQYNQNAKREAWEDLKKLLHYVYD